MKRGVAALSLLALLAGINSLFNQTVLAGDKRPFHAFDLADYDINKPLSDRELQLEIVAYSSHTRERLVTCSNGDNKVTNEDINNNPNLTNFCPDFHASDYLRLSYLFFLNASQNLSPEVLNFVDIAESDPVRLNYKPNISAISSAGYKIYIDSLFQIFPNINFITDQEGKLLQNANFVGTSFVHAIAQNLKACSLSAEAINRSQPSAGETQRMIFLNKDTANEQWKLELDECKNKVFQQYGQPLSPNIAKTCANEENKLKSSEFDINSDTNQFFFSGQQITNNNTIYGACYSHCQNIIKQNCQAADHCFTAVDSNNVTKRFKQSNNPSFNQDLCRSCLSSQLKQKNPSCIRLAAEEQLINDEVNKCEELYKGSNSLLPITCDTMFNVLSSTTATSTTSKIIASAHNSSNVASKFKLHNKTFNDLIGHFPTQQPKWLPLTDREKALMNYGLEGRDENNNKINIEKSAIKSICSGTGFKALICMVVRFFGTISDGVFSVLESMLNIPPHFVVIGDQVKVAPNYHAWLIFRDIANFILILIAILLVLAQVTHFRPGVYNFRKTLPTFIFTAILINFSYYLCQVAIDISNLLGYNAKFIIENLITTNVKVTTSSLGIANKTASLLATVGFTVVSGTLISIGALAVGLSVLLPLILGVLVSAIMTLFVLSFRQIIVITAVFVSPIAIAMLALPGTRSLFRKWAKTFIACLLVYPIVSITFSVGKLAYTLVNTDSSFIMSTFSVLLLILPLFLIPSILARAMKSLPLIGNNIQNLVSGTSKRAKQRFSQSTFMQDVKRAEDYKKSTDKLGKSRPSPRNPLSWVRSNFNRQVVNRLPIYRTVRQVGEIDPKVWEEIQDMSNHFDKNHAIDYLDQASRGIFAQPFDQKQLFAAILMASSQGDSSHEIIANAIDQARSKHNIDDNYLSLTMNKAMNNYRDEGDFAEYAMFKLHHDMATSTTKNISHSGFQYSWSDFQNAHNQAAQAKGIQTAFLRANKAHVAKFKGYDSLDASSSAAKHLAKQVIEGGPDVGGLTPLVNDKFWLNTVMNDVRDKNGLAYVQRLKT